MPYLSVVIPAYNEEKNIRTTLAVVEDYLHASGWEFEIVVVNDGSQDNTSGIVSDYIEGKREFTLINNPHRGKAYAVKTGVLKASGDYILFSDADLATPINEIKRMLVWLTEQGFDLVIASREGIGAKREGEPYYRHLMGRIFNFVVQNLALKGINDSQCGFKLFRRDVARRLFSSLYVYGGEGKEINTAYLGAFDVELLFLARKFGYKIREVSVTWSFVKTKRLNPLRDSWKMFWDVVKIRLADLRGCYTTSKY
ncbi:MAG: glycosyltransferase family 2 protein [bacterium]|nr:glycosyltransferase family 2 protein [bacterium]